MASVDLRKELECPVCLGVYIDPVILRCGHNFCRICIDRVLNTQEGYGGYSCPECREEFMERPTLQRNNALRRIALSFLSTQLDQEEARVFCSHCVASSVKAVKYCLLCDASLCDNHLRVHSKAPEHVLCDISLVKKKCSAHKKFLEYYCTEDAACICVSCTVIGGHVGHKMMSLDEASEEKKKKLRNDLQRLMAKTEEAEKRVQSLEDHKRKVQEKADSEKERVSALFKDLRRRLDGLEMRVRSEITRQAQQVILPQVYAIRRLEVKKEELSRNMHHIEELCSMIHPLTVLQESDTGDLCDTEDRERHDKQLHDGGDLDVAGISHTLHTGLSDIMSGVIVQKHTDTQAYPHSSTEDKVPVIVKPPCPQPTPTAQQTENEAGLPNIEEVLQTSGLPVYADIILDVNTACSSLWISDDRKTVVRSDLEKRSLEERDDAMVLSLQSFSSGRHYWEVDVGELEFWSIGMCYPSIGRRHQAMTGFYNKAWCLENYEYIYSVAHNEKRIEFPEVMKTDKIRIYLDYEAGQISFYALCDPNTRHLYTFTTTFTEPLHAVLGVLLEGSIKISGGNQ